MKTAMLLIWAVCIQTGFGALSAVSTRIVKRDADHEVIESVRRASDGVLKTNHYTHVGNQINYQDDDGNWIASKPVVQSFSGGILCTGASYQVILGTNLNIAGAVDLLTADKKEIVSSPIGIAFYDPLSGKRVLLAQIKDCGPTLVSSNRIMYPDAFEGSGIEAAVIYEYRVGHFSQDIKFLKQPSVTPSDFGLSQHTRLEILTEFLQSPTPVTKDYVISRETNQTLRALMVEPDVVDQMVDFGAMHMLRGRAFPETGTVTNRPPARGIGVAKRWANIGGRTILVEAIPWHDAQTNLANLPMQVASEGTSLKAVAQFELPRKSAAKLNKPFKSRLSEIATSRPLLFASAAPRQEQAGFVIDYTTVGGGTGTLTLDAGETYLFQGQIDWYGEVFFNQGAVLKYDSFSGLNVYGHISSGFGGGPTIVFTSIGDDSDGYQFGGGEGTPYLTAAYALAWEDYGDQDSFLISGDFRWCYGAINVDDSSQHTFYVNNCSVNDSQWCINNNSSTDPVVVSGGMYVCNVYMIEQGNVSIDSLSDCNPNQDTDGDGLPDVWEVQYFHNLNKTGSGDYDGDHLTNLREYQYHSNPTVAETDSDGDGMADWWEIQYGLSPQIASGLHGASGDLDGDGVSNLAEYRNGTNPVRPDSQNITMGGRSYKVLTSALTGTGKAYDVYYRPDSAHKWRRISSTAPGQKNLTMVKPDAGEGDYILLDAADADADGLSDGYEGWFTYTPGANVVTKCDPQNARLTCVNFKDSLGYGQFDGWKVAHGLNPVDITAQNDPNYTAGAGDLTSEVKQQRYYAAATGADASYDPLKIDHATDVRPVVTISSSVANFNTSTFTFTRDVGRHYVSGQEVENSLAGSQVVYFCVGGGMVFGQDYTLSVAPGIIMDTTHEPLSITIPANQHSTDVTIAITPGSNLASSFIVRLVPYSSVQ